MAMSFFSVVHELRRTYAVYALTSGIPFRAYSECWVTGHRL